MPHLILAADFGSILSILMVVVGLGGLIFFHELGHFLACRATGTRVDCFSIGFGPQIFGWRRGHTLYRVAWIPLGGYVKMAAENPGERGTGAPDELPSKSFSQRLLIFSAGVIFNVVLAFILFAWAFGIGVPFPSTRIGGVEHGGPAWAAGFRPGDVVKSVNGEKVVHFKDIQMLTLLSDEGEALHFKVDRAGTEVELEVVPLYSKALGMPTIGLRGSVSSEAGAVVDGSPVALAGGKVGDTIVFINGDAHEGPIGVRMNLASFLQALPEGTTEAKVVLEVRSDGDVETHTLELTLPLKPGNPMIGVAPFTGRRIEFLQKGSSAVGFIQPGDELLAVNGAPVADLVVFRSGAGDEPLHRVRVMRDGTETKLDAPPGTTVAAFASAIAGAPQDLESTRVSPLPDGGASRAGLQAGDKIVEVDGEPVSSWAEISERILGRDAAGPIPLKLARGAQTLTLEVSPKRSLVYRGESEYPSLGYEFSSEMTIQQEKNIANAITMGFKRTKVVMWTVVDTIGSLLSGRVSHKLVGGPIMLAETTHQMWQWGFAHYLYILAIISINLAVLNILPIPVLDGGQIVFLIAEKVRGEPLPERVIGAFQVVGLILILGLVALAFTNDITRILQ